MRRKSASVRTRLPRLGLPAAVLGTLAGTLIAPSAHAAPADVATRTAPLERLQPHTAREVPAAAPTSAPAPTSYTVASGDSVFAIAERFGLRTADVLAWNGLSWHSVIHPGQTLTLVPASAAPAPPPAAAPTAAITHTVVTGDTVYAIARKHGTSVDAVLAANGLSRAAIIYPGQTLRVSGAAPAAASTPSPAPVTAPPPAAAKTHTVVAGDTLSAIAHKNDTTLAVLYAANGLSAGSIIYPGQKLALQLPTPTALPARSANLNAKQIENARMIIGIGRELGVPDRGIAIALATAMVESGMRNLDYGDRDSLGLFQQRPSTGWGTAEQVRDRDRSIRAFYGGAGDPNGTTTRGLLDIPGWQSMAFTDAAQAVQISAFPDRYGQWEAQSFRWLAQHG